MAASPLIACPKKTTNEVDWAGPIRSIIASTYGEAPDSYNNECAALNRCRQDALRGSAGSDTTARDLLYKYFGQLELLELRFPEIRVPFPWSDAFTNKQISQLSLAYEKASVIFNIAATLSSLASAQNRSSPEGLKRAFNGFRSAAGMFQYINDNFLHAPSTDLSKEVVKCLVVLMSAQATEAFYERMVEERKGAGIKARVCAQAASQYHTLQEEIKDFVVKGWFSRAWSLLIQCKSAYFTSLAQYNRSQADASGSKHGEALARLKLAETSAKEAQRLSNAFLSVFVPASVPTLPSDAATSLVELAKTQVTLVTEAKAAGQSDNDLIYHETVPSEASLAQIEKAVVAEPVPIQETYGTPEVQKVVGPDIFSRLVPLSVHESASLYSEEKAKVVRAQSEACDLADGELRAALEYMGLPASLAKFRHTKNDSTLDALADPGSQARAWSEAVRQAEVGQSIAQLVDALDSLRAKARAALETVEQDLNVEQRECEQARLKAASFSQSPSAGLTRQWRQTLKSHRENLEQASVSDGRNLQEWNMIRGDLGLLLSSDALDSAFAEAIAGAANDQKGEANLLDVDLGEDESEAMRKRVTIIDETLGRLNKIKRERADALKDLKERVQSDDISQLLILNRKNTNVEPQLFAAELEKFRPNQNRIAAAIHHQQLALQEIGNQYKALTEGKAARDIQTRWSLAEKQRRDLLARLHISHDGYFDVRGTFEKGLTFYTSLSDLAASLEHEVSRFVSQRSQERSEMLSRAALDERLGSMSPSDNASSPIDRQFASLDLGANQPARQPSYPAPSPATAYSGYVPPPPIAPLRSSSQSFQGPPISAYSSQPAPSPAAYQSPPPSLPAPPQQPSYSQPQYTRPPVSNGYSAPAPSGYAPLASAYGAPSNSYAGPSAHRTSLPGPPAQVNYSSNQYRPAPIPPSSPGGYVSPPPQQQPYGYQSVPPSTGKVYEPATYGYAVAPAAQYAQPPSQPYYGGPAPGQPYQYGQPHPPQRQY